MNAGAPPSTPQVNATAAAVGASPSRHIEVTSSTVMQEEASSLCHIEVPSLPLAPPRHRSRSRRCWRHGCRLGHDGAELENDPAICHGRRLGLDGPRHHPTTPSEEVMKGDSVADGGGGAWKELATKPGVRHVLAIVSMVMYGMRVAKAGGPPTMRKLGGRGLRSSLRGRRRGRSGGTTRCSSRTSTASMRDACRSPRAASMKAEGAGRRGAGEAPAAGRRGRRSLPTRTAERVSSPPPLPPPSPLCPPTSPSPQSTSPRSGASLARQGAARRRVR
jgi:hypothetical protein